MSKNPARDEAERLVTTVLTVANGALQAAALREQAKQVRDVAGWLFGPTRPDHPPTGPAEAAAPAGPAAGETAADAPAADAPAADAPAADAPAADRPAADTPGGHRFSTGSADCCVCPVCRLIATLRDPDPELVERLAKGAGDLGVAVAGVLRAFAAEHGGPGTGHSGTGHPGTDPHRDDPWRAATTVDEQYPSKATAAKAAPAKTTARQTSGRTVARKTVARKVVAPPAPTGATGEPAVDKAPGATGTGDPA